MKICSRAQIFAEKSVALFRVGVHVIWALRSDPNLSISSLCRHGSVARPGIGLNGGSRGIPSARNPRFAAREVVAYVRTM